MRRESLRRILTEIANIRKKENFELIMVFGSVARGKYVENISDIDLIVVDRRFRNVDFWQRTSQIVHLFDLGVPVDVFCYTPEELIESIMKLNFLVIDAIEYGIPIPHNSLIYEQAKQKLAEIKEKYCLKRIRH